MREFADMQNIWAHQERLDNLVATDCITCNAISAAAAALLLALGQFAAGQGVQAAKRGKKKKEEAEAIALEKGAELAQHTAQTEQEIQAPTGAALNPTIQELSPSALEESILKRRKEEMAGQVPY